MKKQRQPIAKSSTHSRRPSITLVVTIAILVVTAITVVSKQLGRRIGPTNAVVDGGKQYVTVKVAGRDVQVDPQTGQIKPLSPEEAQKLADGLRTMLNRSTDGLVRQRHPDGSFSMNLQGRFQNVVVARTNSDGTLEQSCVDNPEAAANFFGIDPQLLGVERAQGATNQPVTTPAKKANR